MKQNTHYILVSKNETIETQLSSIIAKIDQKLNLSKIESYDEISQIILNLKGCIVFFDDSLSDIISYDFCKKLKANNPNCIVYFIILSESINASDFPLLESKGADDFATLPIKNDNLYHQILIALKFCKIQYERKELIDINAILSQQVENEFTDIAKVLVKLQRIHLSKYENVLLKVSEASVWIAKNLDIQELVQISDIKIASYLCLAGKSYLPNYMKDMPILKDGVPTNPLMAQIPQTNREICSGITRLENVGEILYHIYENLDGSGFPEKKQNWQIPLSSRIIRVALDFYLELNQGNQLSKDIIQNMLDRINRLYDHRVVHLMSQYLRLNGHEEFDISERAILPIELREGMIVSRDLITMSNIKLISSGTQLSERTYNLIMNHIISDPPIGYIFIKN